MSVRYGVAENTARLFMHKVRETMKSKGNNDMNFKTLYIVNTSSQIMDNNKVSTFNINRSQSK